MSLIMSVKGNPRTEIQPDRFAILQKGVSYAVTLLSVVSHWTKDLFVFILPHLKFVKVWYCLFLLLSFESIGCREADIPNTTFAGKASVLSRDLIPPYKRNITELSGNEWVSRSAHGPMFNFNQN